MKAMVVDVARCNGCHNCQVACKDEHVGNDWAPYARPQPNTGQFWARLEERVRGSVPKVKVAYTLHICQHCRNAPCMSACKQDAIYRREDGAVLIDPGRCKGEKHCLEACPYGVIFFNEGLQIGQKCTWCAHLLDKGWKVPRCVDACPTAALKFGEEAEYKDLIARAELMKPEAKAGPRVYYLGLPKRFIAGAVFDPDEDECLQGATVTLTDSGNAKKVTSTLTDQFGDFWFEGLEPGRYSVLIEKKGYAARKLAAVDTDSDVNLGDLAMRKES